MLLRRQDIWEIQSAARWCLLLRYDSLSQYSERVCLIDRYGVIVSVLVYWLGWLVLLDWLWLERSITVGKSLASPHTARPLVICRLSKLKVALVWMSRRHYSATKPCRLLLLDLSDNTACATATVSANSRAESSVVTSATTLIILIGLVCLLTVALVASASSISPLMSASVLLLLDHLAGAEGCRVLPRLLLRGLEDIWSTRTTKDWLSLMLWNA